MSFIATSQEDAAATLGINVRTFARWLKRGCPGKSREYRICDCIKWARENVWSEEGALIEGATGEEDDIKTQYLKHRIEKLQRETELADLKIGERNEQLVDINVIQSGLTRASTFLREALEKLERLYGADALDIVLEALDELDKIDLCSEAT